MQSPRPRRGARGSAATLQSALRGFLKESGLSLRLGEFEVRRAWDAALGAELARRARPVRFQSGVLEVEVQSAAHLTELASFTGESFRRAANARLGSERIERVTYHLKR